MRILTIGLVASLAACSAIAYGQYWGGYPSYHASTAAEGAARGVADVTRSQGMANLFNSQAAINMTEAQRNDMENRQQWTNTYFQMRQANTQYRAQERGPQTTMEQAVRYAQAGKPQPLSPSDLDTVDGEINWPVFLKTPAYAEERAKLDALYGKRAELGGITADDYAQINRATQAMLDALKSQVREIPPSEYVATKKFVESLAYEANRTPS
jgi:hypothetical protein